MSDNTIANLPPQFKEMFNKGVGAFERGNLDYAIDMFTACLEADLMLHDVRKFLRVAEIKKFKEKRSGTYVHMLTTFENLHLYGTATVSLKAGETTRAIKTCETLLRNDPLNLKFVNLFCDAVEAAGRPDLSIQTLAIVSDYYPENPALFSRLGHLYLGNNQPAQARECFEAVLHTKPHDGDAIKALKDAMALQSLSQDSWGAVASGEKNFRSIIKDSKEAELLEKESKAIRTTDDTSNLIEDAKAKIERDPNNLNYYRNLASLYSNAKMFTEAMEVLKKAEIVRGHADPDIDATLASIQLKQFDHEIAELTKNGEKQAVEELRGRRNDFYHEDISNRVAKYPNDLNLRYEYGVSLFLRDMHTEAIQQFQLSQRNPRWHVKSLYYLGLSFEAKGQHDLAVEQLEKAAEELISMDTTKKDILYELGRIKEVQGDIPNALQFYKQIYQADIGYKDIARKVEQTYRN